MASFTLEEIEKATGASLLQKGEDAFVEGVSTDTRTIPGANFSSLSLVKISTVMNF